MTSTESNNQRKAKQSKKKKNFGYFYLFAFVFFSVLVSLSYILKSYSPDIDVAIGNNEALTLSESDMDVEIKSIDERLKWIQMEDELPTVAKRDNAENNNTIKEEENSDIKPEKPPIPKVEDIKSQRPDFRNISPVVPVIPLPQPPNTITKVYLGTYNSLEEAMSIQNKVSADEPTIEPFIKAIRDTYIVQLGSFSDKELANALIEKLKEKGYTPKILSEN